MPPHIMEVQSLSLQAGMFSYQLLEAAMIMRTWTPLREAFHWAMVRSSEPSLNLEGSLQAHASPELTGPLLQKFY